MMSLNVFILFFYILYIFRNLIYYHRYYLQKEISHVNKDIS